MQRQKKREEWREKNNRQLLAVEGMAEHQNETGCTLLDTAANFPDYITSDEYFAACPGGIFRDPDFPPVQDSLTLLMSLLEAEKAKDLGSKLDGLNSCSYFMFSGSEEAIWDATFYARLAWEGFFTITTKNKPLPELQPFYGVLTWPNFNSAKHVRSHIAKLRRSQLALSRAGERAGELLDPADAEVKGRWEVRERRIWLEDIADRHMCWERLDKYHRSQNGRNWLTERYFKTMVAASDDPAINFRLHTVCLLEGERDAPEVEISPATVLAGEIGYSIGRVYTSLSGWTEARSSEAVGTTQLVLLGLWLQV